MNFQWLIIPEILKQAFVQLLFHILMINRLITTEHFQLLEQRVELIKFVPDPNFVGINYLTVTATDDDLANATLKDRVSCHGCVRRTHYKIQGTTELTTTVTRNIVENNNWEIDLTSLDLYDDPPASSLYWSLSGNDSSKFKLHPHGRK